MPTSPAIQNFLQSLSTSINQPNRIRRDISGNVIDQTPVAPGPQGLDFLEAFGPGRQSVQDRAAVLNQGQNFDLGQTGPIGQPAAPFVGPPADLANPAGGIPSFGPQESLGTPQGGANNVPSSGGANEILGPNTALDALGIGSPAPASAAVPTTPDPRSQAPLAQGLRGGPLAGGLSGLTAANPISQLFNVADLFVNPEARQDLSSDFAALMQQLGF